MLQGQDKKVKVGKSFNPLSGEHLPDSVVQWRAFLFVEVVYLLLNGYALEKLCKLGLVAVP